MRSGIGVFANYNTQQVGGGALENQNPNVHTYPWVPTQKKVRQSPVGTGRGPHQVAGSANQRVTPNEKGKTWSGKARNLGLQPTSPGRCPKSGGGCSCGGTDGGGGGVVGPGDKG
jgi:hypothetical protein